MELKGSKTEQNLQNALTGESLARNRYAFFAMHAKECGEPEVAELFDRLAVNEMMHARAWYGFLHGKNASVKEDLKAAAQGEFGEWHNMYPGFAATAREEGFEKIAAMFENVAKIECDHEMQFMKMFSELTAKAAKKEPSPAAQEVKPPMAKMVPGYRCQFCGAVYEKPCPDVCGVCQAIGSFDPCTFRKQGE